jgi:4-hydroxy-tetrahydrodipicolinate synthase
MAMKEFRGFFGFVVTPTRDDGDDIDEDRLCQLLDWVIGESVHGVCVLGSTGANGVFTDEERLRVIRRAVTHVRSRVPVIAGVSSMTTAQTANMARAAEEAGADGVIVVPMNYWPLTEAEVYSHYRTVAAATHLPLVIYNNPWTTSVDIKPPIIARLAAETSNIRYVKESTADLTRVSEILRLTEGRVTVFCGWDSLALQHFASGAEGWFGGMTNLIPRQCAELFELAVERKDLAAAQNLWKRIFPLCQFMCDKTHVRVAHTALELMGRPMGPPRRPLRMLGEQDRERLAALLGAGGFLT